MTEQQKLQNAKDAVAKELGYDDFEHYIHQITVNVRASERVIKEYFMDYLAIKYQQLCEAEYIECLTELRNTYLYGIDDNGDVKASMSEIIELWNKVNELLPQPPK